LVCLECGRPFPREKLDLGDLPPVCSCGGWVKPDVVLFGEMIPQRALLTAMAMAGQAKVILVVGTSAVVAPASQLPLLTKQAGGVVVEINPEPTPLTREVSDFFFQATAADALPLIAEAVQARQGG
jgi:NAD-dependent deacetylase